MTLIFETYDLRRGDFFHLIYLRQAECFLVSSMIVVMPFGFTPARSRSIRTYFDEVHLSRCPDIIFHDWASSLQHFAAIYYGFG
jgi:hypothetical protein